MTLIRLATSDEHGLPLPVWRRRRAAPNIPARREYGARACARRPGLPARWRSPAQPRPAAYGAWSPASVCVLFRDPRLRRCRCGPMNCGRSFSRAPDRRYRLTGGGSACPKDCLTVAAQPARGTGMVAASMSAGRGRASPPPSTFTPASSADAALFEAKTGRARPEMTVQAHL